MNARRLARIERDEGQALVNVALLGTGAVGNAFLARLGRLQARGLATGLRLVQVANSQRCLRDLDGLDAQRVAAQIGQCAALGSVDVGDALVGSSRFVLATCVAPACVPTVAPACLSDVADVVGRSGLVIDATASEDVASWHPRWLASGLSVVTANKAGTGGELARYRAIAAHAARYGDAATVGAGLPLLRTLRELRAGGDYIHGLAGVLSGSLAWLFNHYDGMRPFSAFVREARMRGYTEPDPRHDLSGSDVRRKLLILARNAGFALAENSIAVESLLPQTLANAAPGDVDAALESLDAPLRERYQSAYRNGKKLRFVARLDADGRAHIGLEQLAPEDALACGSGCDNRLAIHSDRYCENPLVIQGPGAGAEVTAAALLDDALRLMH